MRKLASYRSMLLVGVLSVSIFSLNTFVMLPAAVVSNQPQPLLQSAFATFPGENGLIAFSARPDSQTVLGIYVMRSDGTGQIRINAEDGYGVLSSGPVWSPDGSKIAFSHYDANSVSNVHVMNYDGSNQIALTNYPIDSYVFNGKISWSPDSSKIAFTSIREDGQSDIYVMNAADGSQVQRLTTNTREDQYPDWSPDGSKIVFESNRDGNFELYVINPNGSGETRLTRTSNEHEQLASWSPDSSKIAFQSGNNPDIYVMNADGAGRVQLTNNVGEQPVWSPEGDKIAFTKGYQEIYVMDAADGTNQVPLTGEQLSLENGPDWGSQTILPFYEQDTTAPVITVPPDITAQATTANGGTVVTYSVSAEDNVDGAAVLGEDGSLTQDNHRGTIDISCEPSSGSEFPIGETIVECTATDALGNVVEPETFAVTVNPPPSITCEGQTATIVGTSGNDNNIRGTSGRDVIAGLGGNDRIGALGGNDIVCGGEGNDVIDGGSGVDRLYGDDESNNQDGGTDRVVGSSGNDYIHGGSGNDLLAGSTGDDEIHGSSGTDDLRGLTGTDRLYGEDNDDRLDGGSGRDNGDGGSGLDRCIRVETVTNCEA